MQLSTKSIRILQESSPFSNFFSGQIISTKDIARETKHASPMTEEKTDIIHIFEWFLDEKNTENAVVICSNLGNVIKECLSKFKLIKAAGGIVQNSENKYLLILYDI